MSSTVAERVARTQATFRDANERIEQTNKHIAAIAGAAGREPLPFICECCRRSCVQLARLTMDDYATIRAHSRRFLVVPGHEICRVEDLTVAKVVERRDSFSVMEKIGEAGEIAARLDGRARADG